MTVNDKINFRENAVFYLTVPQYLQLVKRDLLSLAPYYFDRLKCQAEAVREVESFKNIFGKYRYQLENNINT
jgi:hypothetical protein